MQLEDENLKRSMDAFETIGLRPLLPVSLSDFADGEIRAAEEAQLDASLSATPEERLAWLEEAIRFAWRAGALNGLSEPPEGDESSDAAGD